MNELFHDLAWSELTRSCVRLLAAAMLGSTIGLERQVHRQYAGLRTHILVTLGAAAFVLLALSVAETSHGDPLRVVQGVAIGIGFLGSGAILKVETRQRVQGLTTAGGIWNAAAIGVAVGAGYLVLGLAITAITLVVLGILRIVERKSRLTRSGVPE